MAARGSRIFLPFRALGFISNNVPLSVRFKKQHNESYAVTCVGKAFHIFAISNLGLTQISDCLLADICCLATDAYYVFAACLDSHLYAIDAKGKISSIVHPNTYLNKIVLGSKQGNLQLWNIKVGKLIYAFEGWDSSIDVLSQAPALDVLAIGLADGRIIVHNIKYDETIMQFKQDWGPITCLSFRTDGAPILVSGSSVGHVAVWDLENRCLASQLRDAHDGAVCGMQCLPDEPLMVTSSGDNSLKVQLMDGRVAGHIAEEVSRFVFKTLVLGRNTIRCLVYDRIRDSPNEVQWSRRSGGLEIGCGLVVSCVDADEATYFQRHFLNMVRKFKFDGSLAGRYSGHYIPGWSYTTAPVDLRGLLGFSLPVMSLEKPAPDS